MLSKSLIYLALVGMICFAQAQDQDDETIDLKSMKEKLEYEFKSLDNQVGDIDLGNVLTDLAKKTKEYIHFRKLECRGEFSTIVIDQGGQTSVNKKKLSKIETKLCMLELINFQRQFGNVIFDLRKKILLKQHQKQIQQLEEYRQNNIDELEKMAAGYR